MNDRQEDEINSQLAKDELRIAGENERGYYALAHCNGEVIKVWANDVEVA